MGIRFQRADIVLVDLGTVRNVQGHEQALKRPCVIIKPLNSLKLATVVPLTTSRPPQSAEAIVKIHKGSGNLSRDSYVLLHQIRTISCQRIIKRISQLSIPAFEKIQWELKYFLGL
jgi:mRNA-degrading endonuclease toxin of MazEF toxin-antitoxin module